MHSIKNCLTKYATLRQLQVFESIARNKSFTRAAEELYLTQPTVSMQIKKLSNDLELRLFDIIGRKVYLTEAGELVYKASKTIIDELAVAEENLNNIRGIEGGRINIAVTTTAQYLVSRIIKIFKEKYKNVSIEIFVVNKENLIDRIHKNQDDFYILGQPPESLEMYSIKLCDNPLEFIVSSKSLLANKKNITLSDLEKEDFIIREQGSGIRSQVLNYCQEINFQPNIKYILGSNELIRTGLIENLGITITSTATVRREIEDNELKTLKIAKFPIKRFWYIAYLKKKTLSKASLKMIEILKENI